MTWEFQEKLFFITKFKQKGTKSASVWIRIKLLLLLLALVVFNAFFHGKQLGIHSYHALVAYHVTASQ